MYRHTITEVTIGKIRPSRNNARTHSKRQVEQIIAAVRRFGWTYPILVDDEGNILCGVGRWLAAQKMGLTKVPVIPLSHLGEIEKRALMLADNKIAANSGWDRNVLARELGELSVLLPEIDLDIEIKGFSAPEVDMLLGELIDPEADPADLPPAPAQTAVSQKGDLWTLGEHRLACGDACLETDVHVLMGGDSAAMIFADTPYNRAIRAIVGRGKIKHREFAAASGEMSPAQFIKFLTQWMRLAARFSDEGSIHFIAIDWRHLTEILQASQDVYGSPKNLAVWIKTNAGQGSFYRSQHELIFVFKNGDAPHQNNIELGKHDLDLLAIDRGTVTAPAGCGKTHLISQALARHAGPKPILVLTHTNAGVAALRSRLDKAGVRPSYYRLTTIDGWCMRLLTLFPKRAAYDQ